MSIVASVRRAALAAPDVTERIPKAIPRVPEQEPKRKGGGVTGAARGDLAAALGRRSRGGVPFAPRRDRRRGATSRSGRTE